MATTLIYEGPSPAELTNMPAGGVVFVQPSAAVDVRFALETDPKLPGGAKTWSPGVDTVEPPGDELSVPCGVARLEGAAEFVRITAGR
jgi:hypothetical protein